MKIARMQEHNCSSPAMWIVSVCEFSTFGGLVFGSQDLKHQRCKYSWHAPLSNSRTLKRNSSHDKVNSTRANTVKVCYDEDGCQRNAPSVSPNDEFATLGLC